MVCILQINMHRSAIAHKFLAQLAVETKADLVLISEQYRNKDPVSWHPDIAGIAAIWVRDGTLLRVFTQGRGDGFVWIRCLGVTFFSVYLNVNEAMPHFRCWLDALEDAILGMDGRILVGDNFNARALEWGMPYSDSRGKSILEMVVLSTGSILTFWRPGYEGSIANVTFVWESLVSLEDGWRILEDFSASDHQYIAFEVVDTNLRCAPPRRSFRTWNVAKVNTGRFVETLGTGGGLQASNPKSRDFMEILVLRSSR